MTDDARPHAERVRSYSINDETFGLDDIGEVLQTLEDNGALEVGAIYYEIDTAPIDLVHFIDADTILDNAENQILDEIGEAGEDAFFVSDQGRTELDEFMKAWAEKHLTGRYWRCVGSSTEHHVTASDIATWKAGAA